MRVQYSACRCMYSVPTVVHVPH
eukprot:COSAG05_NODE_27212_length_162_cov_6680.714286_1_plen_22_part_01